jgi:hypothetical protein
MDFVSVGKLRRDCPHYTNAVSTVWFSRCRVNSWLALDFRCLHARQAVEAFRDLAGGELCRTLPPVGKGAREGGGGLEGDMSNEGVVLMELHL